MKVSYKIMKTSSKESEMIPSSEEFEVVKLNNYKEKLQVHLMNLLKY